MGPYLALAFCAMCYSISGWAVGRHPACKKTEWWGAGVVICLRRGADLHMMPLPLTLSLQLIQIGFTFLVPARPCSPGQSTVGRETVVVVVVS